jgi:hypothetical protein
MDGMDAAADRSERRDGAVERERGREQPPPAPRVIRSRIDPSVRSIGSIPRIDSVG